MAQPPVPSGRCDVVLLVDDEAVTARRGGRFVPDRHSVEAYVLRCLRKRHARVEVVPFDPRLTPTVERLRELAPRLVFNLTEWIDGDRSQDAAIAGLLDLMKLRYTGTGPAGMRLARDKALSKDIAAAAGAEVPRYFVVPRRGRVHNPGLRYPLVVKPRFGDGSDEVRGNSLVRGERALAQRVRVLRERVDGPLICEEYVPGRDLYVALLGNAPDVMPPVELRIGARGAAAPRLATFRLKNDGAYRTRWRVRWRVIRPDQKLLFKINKISRSLFRALALRDYARIDYRLTPEGRLVFLEANPNPDLHPHAMGIDLCFAGVRHEEAVRRIVAAALRR
jgi:D-alanine-D-alanine ligase